MRKDCEEYKEIVKPIYLRRITGYIVSDITRWNTAKQAELKDRVKHVGVKWTDGYAQ